MHFNRGFSALLMSGLCCILLAGCASTAKEQLPDKQVNEQLYLDARLEFSVQHPLDWQRLQLSVSSPGYRADRVSWQTEASQQPTLEAAEIQILSIPSVADKSLTELLGPFCSSQQQQDIGQTERLVLPAGPALKIQALDDNQGCLAIAIKGQARDFVLYFDYPASRAVELLPIFQITIDSFRELSGPELQPE